MMQQNSVSTKTNINWAFIFSAFVIGLVLTGNFFEYIDKEVWLVGIYLTGLILFTNLLYVILKTQRWAYKTFQVITIVLILLFTIHVVLFTTNDNYFSSSNLTPYELYNAERKLSTEYYTQHVSHKNLTAKITEGNYTISDSGNNDYYFELDPSDNDLIFMSHRIANSDLEIDIESREYKLSSVQKLLDQDPNVILGAGQIPLDLNIEVDDEGVLNIDLEKQNIESLRGLLRGGNTFLKLSIESLPKTRFLVTTRGGDLTLSLPRGISHTIKYRVKETGEMLIEGNKMVGRGEYEIISGAEENPSIVEITAEQGEIIITTH